MTGPGRPLKGSGKKVNITLSVDPEVVDFVHSLDGNYGRFNASEFVNRAFHSLMDMSTEDVSLIVLDMEIESHEKILHKLGERREKILRTAPSGKGNGKRSTSGDEDTISEEAFP